MKKLVASIFLVLFVGVLTSATQTGGSGKDIFGQYKCNKCHTIKSEGIERSGTAPEGKQPPDLSGVGLSHKAAWIRKWLLKEEEQNGKKHIKKFTGSEEELGTLVAWLAGLQKK